MNVFFFHTCKFSLYKFFAKFTEDQHLQNHLHNNFGAKESFGVIGCLPILKKWSLVLFFGDYLEVPKTWHLIIMWFGITPAQVYDQLRHSLEAVFCLTVPRLRAQSGWQGQIVAAA